MPMTWWDYTAKREIRSQGPQGLALPISATGLDSLSWLSHSCMDGSSVITGQTSPELLVKL